MLGLALLALACGTGPLIPVAPADAPTRAAPPDLPTVAPPTAAVLPTVTPAAEPDLPGEYSVAGTNFDGSDYQGRASITRAEAGYNIEWVIGGDTQAGTGTFEGQTLSVRWNTPDGQSSGTATYTLASDGRLSGTWTVDGVAGQGTETLTPFD